MFSKSKKTNRTPKRGQREGKTGFNNADDL